MKKFNWGWGIVLVCGCFVTLIFFLVFKTTQVKDDLVTPDYYAQELKFQGKIDQQRRTHQLAEQPVWNVTGRQVQIKFPLAMLDRHIAAKVLFYKPSAAVQDFTVSCTPDSAGVCLINSEKFQPGIYLLKMDWNAAGVSYYNEGTIHIR